MSWLGWGSATNPQYEELVEKYCSPLNLPYPQSEDIATALEVTDLIRSKTVQPKPAMQSLKRRVASKNGRVQMYAIGLVDTCIKNGGDHFLAEIASKEFVDEMSGLIKSPLTNAEVKQMAIKNFQTWALAFESKRELSFLTDVYKELKTSGSITFPPPPSTTSSHLLTTTTAPAWIDSDVCMRCRTAFTFTNRKHHCRNCGLVFDQQCSSKNMPLPHYGIAEPVRVCDSCYSKVAKNKPAGPAPVVPGRTPRTRQDLDADLQRAIELSLAESQPGASGSAKGMMSGSEPPLRRQAGNAEDDDEQLRLAIEASLREMERERPSAPTGSDEPEYKPLPTFDLTPRETETVLTFSNTLDQMAAYGERDLRRFPHAHVLYEQAYAVGGKLQRNAEEKHTKQQMLAEMQSKLSQAVGLYGQILDGQQAYAARRMQEQQQRQYHQYAHAPQQYQPYGYDHRYASPAPPQANGYGQYAPQAYQHPQQHAAGPSLYPSIPQGQPTYTPQIYQPPQHAQYQHHAQHYPGYAAPPQHHATSPIPPNFDRQHSMNSVHAAPQLQPPQRHASMPYTNEPQGYAISSQPTGESHSNQTASAPPPVDLASHPSTSPQSARSALPSAPPPGIASPAQSNVPIPETENMTTPQPQPTIHQQTQQWTQPQAQAPQQQPVDHSQPAQQQHVYYPQSFPQAPAAVFPDAPSEDVQNKSVEKEEQKEALLIEL